MKRRYQHEQPVSHIDPVSEDELIEDESEVGEEIRKTLIALMPWGVSILAHVGLIVIAFFLVWQTIIKQPGHQTTVPALRDAPDVTAYHNQVDEPEKQESSGGSFIQPVVVPVTPTQPTIPGVNMPPLEVVVPHSNPGVGIGDKPGGGVGDGGPIGLDPGSAKDVVFLIDASGSMVDVLPFVINELKRVVNELPADRKATVIFFSGKGIHEVPGGGGVKGMRTMTPAFKAQIREWVTLDHFNFDTGGRGNRHVASALTRALSYKPQLIILLSDNLTGGGQGATQHELMQDDLIELIHDNNQARIPTRINTVQFLYEDPLVRAGLQGTLDRIADETGGLYRFISQRKLHLR